MLFLRIFIAAIFLYSIEPGGCFALNTFFSHESNPPVELEFPVSCRLEENCRVVNYPDLNPTKDIKDYKNRKITYDGNKGTDIAVQSFMDLKNGVAILAAQDGKVIFVRNTIEDNYPFGLRDNDKDTPFCGNFVLIEHNNGWKTAYCHLKKDSITVKPGDFTPQGKQIGEMGLSGQTGFPHLYFAVLHHKSYFDPFSGQELTGKSEKKEYKPFWSVSAAEKLKYRDVIITNTGISIEDPTLYSIRQGKYEKIEIMNEEPEIFIWVHGFHFKKNDLIKITLQNPDQKIILDDFTRINSDQMEGLISFKKPKEDKTWLPGVYTGKIKYIKPDLKLLYEYDLSFEIKKPPEPVEEEEIRRQERLEKLRMKKRKIIIFHKLKQEDKLPDSYKENKYKYGD